MCQKTIPDHLKFNVRSVTSHIPPRLGINNSYLAIVVLMSEGVICNQRAISAADFDNASGAKVCNVGSEEFCVRRWVVPILNEPLRTMIFSCHANIDVRIAPQACKQV